MNKFINKRALQITLYALAAIPVFTGIITLLGIYDPIYKGAGIPDNALLDSNLRFFGGIWLVLGMALYLQIPKIEENTYVFRLLWIMIFVGGVGRLISMFSLGMPPWPFIGFTVLEIVGAPLMIMWQNKIKV